MKITVKTLQGKMVDFEVEASDSIEIIKKKIEEQLKIPTDQQKLIHYGKVLGDNAKIMSELGIKDKDFLVLMMAKVILSLKYQGKPPVVAPNPVVVPPPVVPPPVVPPPVVAPQVVAQPAVPEVKIPVEQPKKEPEVQLPPPPPPPAPRPAPAPAQIRPNPPVHSENEAAINNLVEMGFPREQVIEALNAAFNNQERATEYLLTVLITIIFREFLLLLQDTIHLDQLHQLF